MNSIWMIYQARRSAYAPGGYEFGFPVKQLAFRTRNEAISSIRADWERASRNGTALENRLEDPGLSAISFRVLDSEWIEYPIEIAIAESEENAWKDAEPKKIRIKRRTFA